MQHPVKSPENHVMWEKPVSGGHILYDSFTQNSKIVKTDDNFVDLRV